ARQGARRRLPGCRTRRAGRGDGRPRRRPRPPLRHAEREPDAARGRARVARPAHARGVRPPRPPRGPARRGPSRGDRRRGRPRAPRLPGSSRVAVVTGAASGLGAATAARLTTDGYEVVGFDRAQLDVTEPGAAERAVAETIDRHGRLDVLVPAAGIVHRRTAL